MSAIIDYVGVTLAGINSPVTRSARSLLQANSNSSNPTDGLASVWQTKQRTTPWDAAFYNAVAAHSLELDDVNIQMVAHPSIQILPGLFALAEQCLSAQPKEMNIGLAIMTAYSAAFDTGIAIAAQTHPQLVKAGWFPVSVLGPLMQAAACAHLQKLSLTQTQMVLGIAANTSAGLRGNSGSNAKPIAAGFAAANGVKAALLAAAGITADAQALEKEFGFFHLFGSSSAADSSTIDKVPLLDHAIPQISQLGLSFKNYPCCAASHTAIESALLLRQTHGFKPMDILRMEVALHKSAELVLIHTAPKNAEEAKFSLEYCVARAILDGEIGPAQFSDAKVQAPAAQQLMQIVKRSYYSDVPNPEQIKRGAFPVTVQIHLRNGELLQHSTTSARGTLDNPWSEKDRDAKFIRCASVTLPTTEAELLLAKLKQFDELASLADVLTILA